MHISFTFSSTFRAKNWPKKFNIDYCGYAANLEFKFKLNFDEKGGSKFKKKSSYFNFAIIY